MKTLIGATLAGSAMLAGLAAMATSAQTSERASTQAPVPAGFTSLFDGKTLKGWRGDTKVWSVKDGTIQSDTHQRNSTDGAKNNTFLILDKPYPNFEMRLKYRFVTKVGNSGLQFRSGQVEGNYVLAGMQSNITPANFTACGLPSCGEERFGMLYEELNRLELVMLGERAVITRRQATTGGQGAIVRTLMGTTNPREAIIAAVKQYPEWNEDVVIVHGNRIVHALNGYLVFDATDNDPLGMKGGLLGLQAHAGPPSIAQFKDIVIKPLTAMPNIEGRFISNPTTTAPMREQLNIKMEKPGTPKAP